VSWSAMMEKIHVAVLVVDYDDDDDDDADADADGDIKRDEMVSDLFDREDISS